MEQRHQVSPTDPLKRYYLEHISTWGRTYTELLLPILNKLRLQNTNTLILYVSQSEKQ